MWLRHCLGTLCWLGVLWFGGCSHQDAPGVAPSAAASALPPLATGPLPDPLPRIAARVNGQPVPTRRVQLFAEELSKKSRQRPEAGKALAYRQALQRLIERELLIQEALAQNVSADDRTVERAYDTVHQAHSNEEEWRGYLAQQGFDPQTFRIELRIRHTVEALTRAEFSRLPPITDAEARTFYDKNASQFEMGEQLRASHIFLRAADALARPKLREQAQAILARVRKGEDFAKLAKEFSQDTATAEKGGELPLFGRGTAAAPMLEAASALQPGQVSDVIDTGDGFHILKLHEKLPRRRKQFAEVLEDLRGPLRQQREAQALDQLLAKLRKKARIETYL